MTKISVDNQIVKLFSVDADKVSSTLALKDDSRLNFSWPSLLEYLGLEGLLSQLPAFDKTQALFSATVSALSEVNNPEDLFYVYDSLFLQMLNQIKALPEMDRIFLLKKIEEKKERLSFWELEKIVSPALAAHEKALRDNPYHAMHDLILYLAWDRFCLCMARLFDYQSADARFLDNLKKIKWCLIESFQHIYKEGRTSPSFYRMVEALFYYQMREEHLHLHSSSDWNLLARSFSALKDPNQLIDFFYIDQAVALDSENIERVPCHLTLDSPELVQQRLDLAQYMMDRLKEEIPEWKFILKPLNVVHLSIDDLP